MSDSTPQQAPLGRLAPVAPRDVWAHEAHDFTPWLLANQDVLGEALGMDLELVTAEHPVGGFSLDLLGRDLATGETVIVENQLEVTDHLHLGQIITYAGGTDPTNIVWIATGFRDEHRAALDWLNTHTDENTRFFGVEIHVVRIGSSEPAPLLRVVTQPNDWGKQVKRRASAATTTAANWTAAEFDRALDDYSKPDTAAAIRRMMAHFNRLPEFKGYYYGNGKYPSATLVTTTGLQPWSVYTAPDGGTVFAVNLDWIFKRGRSGITEEQMADLVAALTPLPGFADRLQGADAVEWKRRPPAPADALFAHPGAETAIQAAFEAIITSHSNGASDAGLGPAEDEPDKTW